MSAWIRKMAPLIGAAVLLLLVGFVSRHQLQSACKGVDIVVHSSADMYFIDRSDVHRQIINVADSVAGQRLIDIDAREIENAIAQMPEVRAVDVYKTIDKHVGVRVDLRVPLARIFEPSGASFYIDKEGRIMPLSTKFNARVLAVNGLVYRTKIPDRSEVPEVSIWESQRRDIYKLAQFLEANPFWKAQIQQLYVDENLEYVLIPRVGNYEIQFGEMNNVETKFKQLNAFYEQALAKSDWNKYSSISLKYKNQIVCNKK